MSDPFFKFEELVGGKKKQTIIGFFHLSYDTILVRPVYEMPHLNEGNDLKFLYRDSLVYDWKEESVYKLIKTRDKRKPSRPLRLKSHSSAN